MNNNSSDFNDKVNIDYNINNSISLPFFIKKCLEYMGQLTSTSKFYVDGPQIM